MEQIEPAAEPLALLTTYVALLHTQCLHTARSQADEGCVFHTASLTPFYITHSKILSVLPQSNIGALYSTTSMP